MPRGSAHRGIMTDNAITVCLVAPPTPRHKDASVQYMYHVWHSICRCIIMTAQMTLYPQTQLSTIPQTQQLQMPACIQDFCTAITMQCFSYAIRSQSVLTTIQLGVSTQHTHTTSEIASIVCLHDFSGPALLSCSKF